VELWDKSIPKIRLYAFLSGSLYIRNSLFSAVNILIITPSLTLPEKGKGATPLATTIVSRIPLNMANWN
jgi:hypothetical protein